MSGNCLATLAKVASPAPNRERIKILVAVLWPISSKGVKSRISLLCTLTGLADLKYLFGLTKKNKKIPQCWGRDLIHLNCIASAVVPLIARVALPTSLRRRRPSERLSCLLLRGQREREGDGWRETEETMCWEGEESGEWRGG